MEAGEEAVASLVATLLDEQSPVKWYDAGEALRGIGRPAFAPLVEAIAVAHTDETRRRCGWAFMGFGADLIDLYADAVSHPNPHVRAWAVLGVQNLKQAGLPALPVLLPLLADPDQDVRQRAIWAMAGLGEGTLLELHRIRVSGPGRLRAGALEAIAEVAGEQAFSAADRTAVERLIRIKLRTETAEAIDGCGMCGSWLALPTGDQGAIIEALSLFDARPATMRLGFAAFYCDGHRLADEGRVDARVFLTPQLDGWTLVLGPWYARWGSADEEVTACRDLSRRFGSAQSYFFDQQSGEGSWVVCLDGELVRAYSQYESAEGVGPRLPVEEGLLLSFNALTDDEFLALGDDYEMCSALTVAAAMSVAPNRIGSETEVCGHGVLALTTHGRTHGAPRGALPI